MAGVDETGLRVDKIGSPRIERAELALVHDPSYIEMIKVFCEMGGGALDMDTVASKGSWEAALRSAGGVRALVEELESRPGTTGFAVSRPPGHHAMYDRAMGFCLFNNVAVTASWLRSRGSRVAILDWDVHHGNGTQAMLEDDPGVLYVSIHQSHFYPFAGDAYDVETSAKGTVVNIPLPAGTGGDVYRDAWANLVMPIVTSFEPDWVLLSSGFDAHVNDSMADFRLVSEDYGWMAGLLAETHPADRTVVALEGGYDLEGLRGATTATLLGLCGRWNVEPDSVESLPASRRALDEVSSIIAKVWNV